MTKLYDTNPYLQQFVTEIESIVEADDSFHIILSETAFYPTGGGQPCDTGMIEDCPIHDVYEKDGIIYHVSHKRPIKIHKVQCTIDWAHRLNHMQHHLAQHLLSALFLETYNTQTLNFQLGGDTCTLDLDKVLDDTSIQHIFSEVQKLIARCVPIHCFYPTKQELKKLKLPKLPKKTDAPIRIVQIDDISMDVCCGIHPQNTLEIMHCLLLKTEKHKSGLRLYFVAGLRALTILAEKEAIAKQALQELTSKYHKTVSEVTALKATVEDYEVDALLQSTPIQNGYRIITSIYEDRSPKSLQRFGAKLVATPNVIALLGLRVDDMAHLVFMCSSNIPTLPMNKLLQDSIVFIDGRGGGTTTSAQGGGKGINNLASALQYAETKVKALL